MRLYEIKTMVKRRWIGVALFFIGAILGVLTNLISGDFEAWYQNHRAFTWVIVFSLVLIGGVLTVFNIDGSKRKQQAIPSASINSAERKEVSSSVAEPFPDPTSLKDQLEMARQVLAIYERQAAGYTTLTIPAQLKINLDEQRSKVVRLETSLRALRSGDEDER